MIPLSSLTLLQINLKAGPDSSSHQTPCKQPLFLQKALFVLYGGFKACISLLRGAHNGNVEAGEMYMRWKEGCGSRDR